VAGEVEPEVTPKQVAALRKVTDPAGLRTLRSIGERLLKYVDLVERKTREEPAPAKAA
jgi:hypothetical protein